MSLSTGRFHNLTVSSPTYQPVYLDLILLLLSHVCGGDAKSRRAEAAGVPRVRLRLPGRGNPRRGKPLPGFARDDEEEQAAEQFVSGKKAGQ